MQSLIPFVPGLPLIGFILSGVLGSKLPKRFSGWITTLAVFGSFLISFGLFNQLSVDATPLKSTLYSWVHTSEMNIGISFLVDRLSIWMMLIITGIGTLIHLYSQGYMHDDKGYYKFFSYLNLFIFSMLLLVMGSNFLVMFFGWEGVGLCSYLLIGFWFTNSKYSDAARKAFIMNRVGDLGLLLGMFFIFQKFGTFEYDVIFSQVGTLSPAMATTICLLLFVGAMGKSAQIPLYTWLPDAMAGPTPVSALIHAATMVTAGIYMIVRCQSMYEISHYALEVVAIVGLATSIFAALIGLRQNDIKKVLAYSTVSQLGLMFLALGVGAYTGAMFHLTTHAFFKALLFLGSGSVIHAMSGQQDIRNMGGLKKYMPITYWTFLLGTLAIIGFPFLSGFFSKDEILAHAFAHSPILWGLALFSSLLTAVYMLRMFFLTFHGEFRGTEDEKHHLHESPINMTLPLMILAVLSVFGGLLNVPHVLGGHTWLATWYEPIAGWTKHTMTLSHSTEILLMTITTSLVLLIMVVCYVVYVRNRSLPVSDSSQTGITKVLANKFYIDELYDLLFIKPTEGLSKFFYHFIDKLGIDGFVNSFWGLFRISGKGLRILQTGNIEFYFFSMVLALLAFILFGIIF
jgi:NADH-quinone oxidoreductase subunit L